MARTAGIAIGLALSTAGNAAPLPTFEIDSEQSSVSGLSSGAFMAVQFAVAYSSIIKGAGVIAGGPYFCARGKLSIATMTCSCTTVPIFFGCQIAPGATKVNELIRITDKNAAQRLIDPTAHVARQRYWLFSGTADTVVPQTIMNDLHVYLRHYVDDSRIRYEKSLPAEHAMPTDDFGNDCTKLGEPYISNCGFDAAGELLQWIYEGKLKPRSTGAPTGRLIEFDQAEFVDGGKPGRHGLAVTGFAYIPASCDETDEGHSRERCTLHIVFHGCRQNAARIGDRFVQKAGYNRWADTNKLIVLYPQTAPTKNNPKACWNWFDAERDDAGYATRNGIQMLAIKRMIDRIAGVPALPDARDTQTGVCFTASNFDHVRAGRAHLEFFMWARANGSNAEMGFADTFGKTTLKQTGKNHYVIGECA